MPDETNLVLENPCTACEGSGGRMGYVNDWHECDKCSGAGYVPTEFGEKLLDLIRHNLRGSASVLRASRKPPGKEQPLT